LKRSRDDYRSCHYRGRAESDFSTLVIRKVVLGLPLKVESNVLTTPVSAATALLFSPEIKSQPRRKSTVTA